MKSRPLHPDVHFLSKRELIDLADTLLDPDEAAVDQCVQFILSETKGLWHGRARAMMCRRLKHHRLERTHCVELVASITSRLESGAFSEQFKDQLRLAMRLDFAAVAEAARRAKNSKKDYIRRYASWVLSHKDPKGVP